jgi:hypothetical protein
VASARSVGSIPPGDGYPLTGAAGRTTVAGLSGNMTPINPTASDQLPGGALTFLKHVYGTFSLYWAPSTCMSVMPTVPAT